MKEEKSLTNLDKFICTVYKTLYIIGLITSVTIMLLLINNKSEYFNILWIISLVIFSLIMYIVYAISKKIKEKKNTLVIKRVTIGRKTIFIIVSIIVVVIVTVLLAIWTVTSIVK